MKKIDTKIIRFLAKSIKNWIKENRSSKNPLIRLGIGGLYLVLITLNNIKPELFMTIIMLSLIIPHKQ